jgi:hypothetical protein
MNFRWSLLGGSSASVLIASPYNTLGYNEKETEGRERKWGNRD